jgi:hypothetical protein
MGPLLPNDISRIAQHVREGEGRKEGKDGEENYLMPFFLD